MSSFTEANREHFNENSAQYDSKPYQQKISQQIADAIQERKEWIGIRWAKPDDYQFGRETRLLDYACGTGSITRALGSSVTNVRGIDISENMVQRYNDDAKAAGLPPERVQAVVGDLCADEVPDHLKTPDWFEFDIAVIGLGFHHFENPMRAIERLTERLKTDTGVLLIIDFLPFDNEANTSADPWQGTIKNRGFTRTNIEKLYTAAGLEKFSFSVLDEPALLEKEGGTVKRAVFIARGRKKPTAWQKVSNWVYDMQMSASDQFQIVPKKESAGPVKLGLFGEQTTGK